jgi:hypothetical protein
MEKFRPKNSLQEKNVYQNALKRAISDQFLSGQLKKVFSKKYSSF